MARRRSPSVGRRFTTSNRTALEPIEDAHAAEPGRAQLVAQAGRERASHSGRPASNSARVRAAAAASAALPGGRHAVRRPDRPRRAPWRTHLVARAGRCGRGRSRPSGPARSWSAAARCRSRPTSASSCALVVARDPQHQPADRIGRAAAVVEHVVPRRVAGHVDVLPERAQQILEQRDRQRAGCGWWRRARRKIATRVRRLTAAAAADLCVACDAACAQALAASRRAGDAARSARGRLRRRSRRPRAQTHRRRRHVARASRGTSSDATGKFS